MFALLLVFFYSLIFLYLILTKYSSSSSSSSNAPTSYPFIGCLISFYQNRHRLLDWYTELLSRSLTQSIVVHRLGSRRTIITANASNVEYILKTNFHNFPKGQPFSEILGDFLGCGIFAVDGESWSTQRKLVSHEFTAKSLREFVVEMLRDEVENRLVPVLEDAMKSETVLDLQDLLKRFAFDVICKVSLGVDPCCLDFSKPVMDLVQAFDTASYISAMRGVEPVQAVWKIKRALNLGSERKLKEALKVVHDSVNEIIQNKKKKIEERKCDRSNDKDLLSRLLLAGNEGEVVRDMTKSFILAGRDTTSAAMTWLFWLLSNHKHVEQMIVSEATQVVKNDEIRSLSYGALKEMNYLKACLCESMRLYPPVAWDSKHALNDDVFPDGTSVKKGDRVTYFPYGMGRMEELWGKDRLEFKPDRWFNEPVIEGGGGALKSVSPFKYPVFQAGPRVCLGKEMSFIQMKYVLASVLSRFEIKPVSEEQPVFVPLLTAHMAGGLKVVVRKRSEFQPGL